MQLPLTPLSFSGTLLLMAMSNFLLWEHVTSSASPRLSTRNLYQRVVELSHCTHDLASKVFTDFNMKFGKSICRQKLMLYTCHTSSIPTPENREQVHQTNSEDLLKVTISVLQAWEEPVKHMVAAVAALPGTSDAMLSRAKELEERVLGLLEGLKIILNRIHPGAVENDYTFWSGWSDLQSSDEATRNIAFYTMGRCLRRDTHKVDNYLKVLKCRDIHNNNC
ncbi:prolactin-3B1 [Mesocricetus auratus]|uniref:Prolactin-3B1 n=2 Tax=Mesocricetus auratus TaxID=10036 RepID=PR3B1_MESAU|nr:prolactin-3B1 [Mesocricetus auratus]P14059.1 RecName: Full=Prolactin-3B1; AltName: Full=Chorionic somatomammotropin hormone 2; AltName: Full=Placental lactogen II; Short=PL-II; Flags: Precursor [Mesocricetus auratus]AAA37088.1 lactogen II precursor [Mesocricetus auratus]